VRIVKLLAAIAVITALACGGRAQPSYPSNFTAVRLAPGKITRDSDGAPYTGTLVARDAEIAEVARVVMAGTPMEKLPREDLGGLILVLPVRDGVPEGGATMRIDLTSPKLSKELRRRLDLQSWARTAIGTLVVAEATFVGGRLEGTALVYGPGGKKLIEARFRENKLHGAAREYFAGTSQVQRDLTFIDGKRYGKERTFYRDGVLDREAMYAGGELHGESVGYFQSGVVRSRGKFDRGKPVGTHARWFPTGQLQVETAHDPMYRHTEWYSNGQIKQRDGSDGRFEERPDGLIEEFHHGGAPLSRTHYANGVKHGTFEVYYASGRKWETGAFANGKQVGPHRKWWKNGKVALEATYVDGELDGAYTELYANGLPWVSVTYARGKKTGAYQKWWKNGKVAHASTYRNGKLDGEHRQSYDNGAKWVEARYANGKPVGTHTRWYPDGRVGYLLDHKDGRPEGPFRRWWADGKPRLEATYVNGALDGEYKNWLADGRVYEIATYKAGVKLKTTLPDKNAKQDLAN
jgi:antitoxin component YwqK of YwqJK toxin-antitoxin module